MSRLVERHCWALALPEPSELAVPIQIVTFALRLRLSPGKGRF